MYSLYNPGAKVLPHLLWLRDDACFRWCMHRATVGDSVFQLCMGSSLRLVACHNNPIMITAANRMLALKDAREKHTQVEFSCVAGILSRSCDDTKCLAPRVALCMISGKGTGDT